MTRRALFAWVAAAALVACAESTDGPAEPVWGKQPCSHCAMIVGEPRFAAQAVGGRGERVWFDDVGCLAAWMAEHPDARRAWVHDGDGNAWLDAKSARYAAGARTPMDYGFVASRDGVGWDAVGEAVARRER